MKTNRIPTLFFILLILVLCLGIVLPGLKITKVTFDGYESFSLTLYNIKALFNTLWMGVSVAAIATFLGFIVAYAISTTSLANSKVIRSLFIAPLLAPSIMPAIGLIYLVGSNGIFTQLNLYGPLGVFLGGLIFALPHAIIQISLSLQNLDAKLFDAGKSLGASPWRCFKTITVPLVKNGIINAFLITFVLTITDFGVPKLLGGSFPVLATEIYSQAIGNQNFAVATILSSWLLLPSILGFYFSCRLKNNHEVIGIRSKILLSDSPFSNLLASFAWGIVLLETLTIVIVIYGSFVTFWPYDSNLTFENYSFKASTYGILPWFNSLILAFTVASLGTILTFCGAYLQTRIQDVPKYLKRIYSFLSMTPLCIPGTVIGLAYALTFNSYIQGSLIAFIVIIFNTIIHLYTVAHLTSQSTLSQLNSRFELVGKSLGTSNIYTFVRVILPLSKNGLIEIFTYLFASAITTISAIVFIYDPQTIMASIASIDLIDSGYISEGAAMCSLIFISATTVRVTLLSLNKV